MEADIKPGELGVCVDCGEVGIAHALNADGLPLCKRCAQRQQGCTVRYLATPADAKAACDAYIAERGGRVVEFGVSCMEVLDGEGFVRLQVRFSPEGKSNETTRSNLSPKAKNGLK